MEIAEALDVVRRQHHAVLATLRRDGTPQMSPVSAVADDDGRLLISSRETAVKTRNLLRDPRAFVCVLPDGFFGRWVQVNGDVEVVPLPEAMEGLVEYYRLAAGEHPDWDEYRAAMITERRVLLRLTPRSAGPDISG
jgi:PPOX class probable F420-dependent enzyme